jgi:hypothetical protein
MLGTIVGASSRRAAKVVVPISLAAILLATPASARTNEINTADTARMIAATALVLMMTIPGLALFYFGMVRKKNVLATIAESRCRDDRVDPLGRFRLLAGVSGRPSAASADPARRRSRDPDPVAGVTYALLKLVSVFVPLRVSREHEFEGLDLSQHGKEHQPATLLPLACTSDKQYYVGKLACLF